jgi:pimeloyl-ACP methyl ester carboxylesterase
MVALLLLPISLFAFQKDSTISLSTPSGKIYGTLTLPKIKTKVPLVLIIAGSGPTDRNGNQEKLVNNSLLALGDSLAKAGIASLRYDKRGIGASKAVAPSEQNLRFDDYVVDAVNWVKKFQHDQRFTNIYIAGHSEGSLIGMLAAQKTPIAGFISIAGVATPADSLIIQQLSNAPTIQQSMVDSIRMYFGMLRRGNTIDSIPQGIYQAFLRKSVQPYLTSWFKYNPSLEIARLKVPVLIVQGSTDIQVDTANAHALASAKRGTRLVMIPNMNHVMKDVPSRDFADNQLSYMDPGFLLKRELTPAIVSFINGIEQKKQKR